MERNELSTALALRAIVEGIFQSGTSAIIDGSFESQIGDFVEQNDTIIVSPEAIVSRLYAPEKDVLLDFGCGTAAHRPMLESMGFRWRGVNYKEGMADSVRELAGQDDKIDFYNGVNLPYEDGFFDIVYSFQVFEHITDIKAVFDEIARTLKPGGSLVGAVSYLEQFHDYSTYNFTPYGLKIASENAGLSIIKLYPSYDIFTWILRRLLIVTSGIDQNSLGDTLHRENNIHALFVDYGKRLGLTCRSINLIRLMFSSHFSFHIQKR
jgi:SAM-dependent methyltransferase